MSLMGQGKSSLMERKGRRPFKLTKARIILGRLGPDRSEEKKGVETRGPTKSLFEKRHFKRGKLYSTWKRSVGGGLGSIMRVRWEPSRSERMRGACTLEEDS